MKIKPYIAIISLTQEGHILAKKLQTLLDSPSQILHKPSPFKEIVTHHFLQNHPMIFICATGIIIRTLAPVLRNKHEDPPILALDENGQFIIPLLSGHEGGANQLAHTLAKKLHAQLVLTSAQNYLQPIYTVGMGCEKHCDHEHLEQLLTQCLAQVNIKIEQVSVLSSLDLKAQEPGLIQLCQTHQWNFETHDAKTLRQVEHLLSEKSDIVFQAVGVYGVAEAAALISGQLITKNSAELLLSKQKTSRATCAIARSYPLNPQQETIFK